MGAEGSLIPENEIGNYTENCHFDEGMNGFVCMKYDFVVMEYESFAPDYNSRKSWPVNQKDGNWLIETLQYNCFDLYHMQLFTPQMQQVCKKL